MALRILAVDDDEQICRMLRMLFEAEGWSVECAVTAGEANALIGTKCFDVVVTDLRMEESNSGMEVAACARACTVPPVVVLLSAARLERSQWQPLVDAYVQKGTAARALVEVIDDLYVNAQCDPPN